MNSTPKNAKRVPPRSNGPPADDRKTIRPSAISRKRKQPYDGTGKSSKDKNGHVHPDKKRKFQDAREISVQMTEDAFQNGQFDVVSFVGSREYEIKSFLRAMNNSRNSQRKRAFQSLPRELRRRTAAHNPSRVPSRVRKIAKKEFIDDNTEVPKKRRDYRPNNRRLNTIQLRNLSGKPGKASTAATKTTATPTGPSRPIVKPSRYKKRQRHKTWLPTHIWSAKRARMTVKWGFSLAETPTLKCYRPTYRAATRDGCIAFDASYMATLVLEGRETDLKRTLMLFTPPKNLAVIGKRVVSGARARSIWIHKNGEWPEGAIAPAQIFWCPESEPGSHNATKGNRQRKLVIRVHAAAFDEVWKILATAAESTKCIARNLRFEIGSIKLVGPRTVEVLKCLLQTETLSSINLDSIDADRVGHLAVSDPRLSKTGGGQLSSSNSESNSELRGLLFDDKARNESVRSQVSQKTLNSRLSNTTHRKGKGVPIVLLKEKIGENSELVQGVGQESSLHDSWTILLPWKWVRPFWLVLMREVGVRLGGLRELEQLSLELHTGYYPTDFIATTAGRAEAVQRYDEHLELKNRRNTMKTKGPSKSSSQLDFLDLQYGYPWQEVLNADIQHQSPEKVFSETKIWQLSPELFRLFSQTPMSAIPQSISRAVFIAHLCIVGRGNTVASAYVYSPPQRGSQAFEELKLQHTRNGKPTSRIFEDERPLSATGKDLDDSQLSEELVKSDSYPIGFIIRSNFGYSDGAFIAIAALSWSQVWRNGRPTDTTSAGWCVLQNKTGTIKRLARWNAI